MGLFWSDGITAIEKIPFNPLCAKFIVPCKNSETKKTFMQKCIDRCRNSEIKESPEIPCALSV